MAVARFVLVPGRDLGGSRASWPVARGLVGQTTTDGSWFAWRLLGGNNRELGRAAGVQPTRELCLDAVAQLRESLAGADLAIVCDTDALSWRWRIVQGGRVLAVSGRAYQRHRECQYSATLFRLAVADPTTRTPDGDPSPRQVDVRPVLAPLHAQVATADGVPPRAVLPTVPDLQAHLAKPRTGQRLARTRVALGHRPILSGRSASPVLLARPRLGVTG